MAPTNSVLDRVRNMRTNRLFHSLFLSFVILSSFVHIRPIRFLSGPFCSPPLPRFFFFIYFVFIRLLSFFAFPSVTTFFLLRMTSPFLFFSLLFSLSFVILSFVRSLPSYFLPLLSFLLFSSPTLFVLFRLNTSAVLFHFSFSSVPSFEFSPILFLFSGLSLEHTLRMSFEYGGYFYLLFFLFVIVCVLFCCFLQ